MNTTKPRDEATAAQIIAIALSDEQRTAILHAVEILRSSLTHMREFSVPETYQDQIDRLARTIARLAALAGDPS